jgi:competence protein ComFB
MRQAVNYSSVYNFYEHLVFDCISTELDNRYEGSGEEFFLDVACYALTCLPSRYIRHEVDMAYYLSPEERAEMAERVKGAVIKAAELILTRQQKRSSE